VAGQTLTLNGTSVQGNANAASPSYTNVSLSFDGQGSAAIPMIYSDVGQVSLLASLSLAATATDPAITLSGTSNSIVVKPYTLAVSAVQTTGGVANPGGTSASGAAAGFVAAGTNFKVSVEARNASGSRTPNFGNETTSENNLTLNNLSLVYPAGGAATALTLAGAFTATTPAGTFINSTVSWGQVGSFTVQPRLGDNDYLSAGDISTPTTSATIGRIYPDHFRLASSTLSNACGSFSYLGQPLPLSYVLQAESASNSVVTNYGNYSVTAPTYVAENADDAQSLGARFATGITASWASGIYSLSSSTASFSRQSSTAAPDGPFSSLSIGLKMTDNFDVRSLQSLDLNDASVGVCAGSCTAKALGSTLNMRYGRLRLDDAFGPETVNLPINFITEYWVGNTFVLNANDSCTLVPRAAITYPSGTLATDANRTVTLSGGTTQGNYASLSLTGVQFNAGTAGHYFSAPSNLAQGSFVVAVSLSSLDWLTFDWDQGKTLGPDGALPNASVSFGSYRGNDRVIYWREKLQ
jgi:MSHA biogenesis protein MshQ